MHKHIRKFKNDKRGSLALEIVIGCVIFITVMCFLMDVAILTWKFSVISQTNTYLARTIGIQGGIKSSAPTGFPGGNTAYQSTYKILDQIQENFDKAGINESDYTVKINGSTLKGTTNIEADYTEILTTQITVKYRWDMLSNILPGNITHSINSRRSVMSEYKYRYDDWIGE